MDVPQGVLYTGVLFAITVGMTAWRIATPEAARAGLGADRLLAMSLVWATGLFIAMLGASYLPGYSLP